jgi:hypothetical protein
VVDLESRLKSDETRYADFDTEIQKGKAAVHTEEVESTQRMKGAARAMVHDAAVVQLKDHIARETAAHQYFFATKSCPDWSERLVTVGMWYDNSLAVDPAPRSTIPAAPGFSRGEPIPNVGSYWLIGALCKETKPDTVP